MLYLFIFEWPQIVNVTVLFVLALLVFVPIKFVSFSTPGKVLAAKTLSLVYFVLLIMVVARDSIPLALISLVFPLLYFGYAFYLTVNPEELFAAID